MSSTSSTHGSSRAVFAAATAAWHDLHTKHASPGIILTCLFEPWLSTPVSVLKSLGPLKNLTHIVLTQLDPKNIPSLEAVLRAMLAEAGSSKQVQVVVSNPAARLLQSVLGESDPECQLGWLQRCMQKHLVQVAEGRAHSGSGKARHPLTLMQCTRYTHRGGHRPSAVCCTAWCCCWASTVRACTCASVA